ncbi:acyl-CoA N-acyltransferase [Gongronella butleri]|nr:acyl-CoA N-acyltransferase [Gongronella butleri]
MDVKIIQPDTSYAQVLSDLGRRLFSDTFAQHNPPEELQSYLDTAYTVELQHKELGNPTMYTFLAFDNNVPVAFCQMHENKKVYDFVGDPDAIELQRIYVDKRCAGKGVGKRLMQQCIAKAQELGKKTMWLGVWEENHSAIGFYKSHGFKKVGTHIFKVGNKEDTDEIMIRNL